MAVKSLISKALSGQTNISKSFRSFFIEAMELFLTIPNRINYEQRGKSGIKMLPLCRNYQRRMVTPDIETSTREERLEFIREEFKCLGNCPICGKCSFLRGREAEDLYADYIEGRRSFRDITAEHRNNNIR